MNDMPTIDDFMATNVISLSPNTDIHQAIKILVGNRISGAPVLDEDGNLVGILSKKDCFKVAFSASYHRERGGPVSEYMTADVETVPSGTSIIEMAERFLKGTFRRFPVVGNGRVIGVISRHDILKAIEQQW